MTYTLGVDLGTTFTAAAVDDGSGPVPLRLGSAADAMPSVVAIQNGEPITGEAAEEVLRTTPSAGVREAKRRFGDSTPLIVDGTPFGAEALMGLLLADVIKAATKEQGEPPASVVLSHPANWGDFKKDLLSDTARVAGLEDVGLITEPQAAAINYVHSGELEVGQTVGVYDFGGGTFDAAIVRCAESGPELLGEAKGLERLGGIDLDQAILMHVNESVDGALRELDASDPGAAAAMAAVRTQCVAAKETLSTAAEATIQVALPGLSTDVRLTRSEFEAMLRPRIDDTLKQFDAALESADVSASDLSAVLLVGGTSRIPLVEEMVAAHTGVKVVASADHKTVVCAGAAAGDPPAGATDEDGTVTSGGGAFVVTGPNDKGKGKYGGGVSRRKLALIGGAGVLAAGGAVATAAAFGASPAAALGVLGLGGDDGDGADAEVGAGAMTAGAMDEFDDGMPGPAGADGAGAAAPAAVASVAGASSYGATPMARAASVSQRGSASSPTTPQPTTPPTDGTTTPTTTPTVDPEFLQTKAALLESVKKWQPPEGVDPKDADAFRAELLDRIERFQPMPGESTEHALAAMKDEYQDQVKDFVQDQKIEDILKDQAAEDAAAAKVDAELGAAKQKLLDGLEKYQPPPGVDPEDYAAMRADIEALVSRYTPVPGQTAEEAMAELRYQYENRVHELGQDMRIEDVADDLTRVTAEGLPTTVHDGGTTISYGPAYADRATNPPKPNVTENEDGTQTVTFVDEQGRQVIITTSETPEAAIEKYQQHSPPPPSSPTLSPDAYTTRLEDLQGKYPPLGFPKPEVPDMTFDRLGLPLLEEISQQVRQPAPEPEIKTAPAPDVVPEPDELGIDDADDSVVGDDLDLDEFEPQELPRDDDEGEETSGRDRDADREDEWPDEFGDRDVDDTELEPAYAGTQPDDEFGSADSGDPFSDEDADDAFASGGDESADEFDVSGSDPVL